jgi:glutamine synthetase type III
MTAIGREAKDMNRTFENSPFVLCGRKFEFRHQNDY